MRRRWAAALLGLATALALTACGGNPPGVDGGIADDWKPMAEPRPFVPESGVCHASAVESGYRAAYAPVDCAATHLTETVHVGTFTGDAAQGDSPWRPGSRQYRTAFDDCGDKADAFLGGDWLGARLSINLVLPPAEAWSGGSRWYRCDLAEVRSLDDTSMVSREGSLAGALAKPSPLRYGCFNPRTKDGVVEEMVPVACDKPHRSEFVGIWTAPDSSYQAFIEGDEKAVHRGCQRLIAAYAKVPNDGDIQYRTGTIYFSPTAPEWEQGNRGVKCFSWDSTRTLNRSIKGGGPKLLPVR